jgi:hypothetical protein
LPSVLHGSANETRADLVCSIQISTIVLASAFLASSAVASDIRALSENDAGFIAIITVESVDPAFGIIKSYRARQGRHLRAPVTS